MTGTNALRVVIQFTVVRGSVTLDGTDTGVTLNGGEVRGDVVVVNTTNPLDQNVIDIVTVEQSVTFSINQSAVGNRIGGNVIDGNLTCDGNFPAPSTSGSPNTVAGARLGQCAGL